MAGKQIGYSSKLDYDDCANEYRIHKSTSPISYILDPHSIAHCNPCLAPYGPRSNGNVSHAASRDILSPKLALAPVESILRNLHIKQSKCRDGQYNPIDINAFNLHDAPECHGFIDGQDTRLTHPPSTYRGSSINRFFDPIKPAQENIFYPFAINTSLEARDNMVQVIPSSIDTWHTENTFRKNNVRTCRLNCKPVV